MIFNSIAFAVFFVVVFFLYWFAFSKTAKSQNIVLLSSSLVFYGWVDWRFLGLILFNACFNYFLGITIYGFKSDRSKNRLLWFGILVNISVLGFFKYFNFFFESFLNVFNYFGANLTYNPLHIILPLGISFFTFQTLGYIIDVYNDKINPSRNLLEFITYVSYFPKILAGPIERAQKFLPQIESKRLFDNQLAADGMRQILWGLFKKVVIADRCATIVIPIFNNYQDYSGSTLFLGLFLYLFQIYCDFSGYSDIAIGVSKLLGIRLMKNFASPFFSTNISDFWKRWHISLTTWMMDYVFTPLSFMFRRYNMIGLIISIITTFIIVGIWHGANWTFIFYGLLHGLYFIPIVLKGTINKSPVFADRGTFPSLNDFIAMSGMFLLLMCTTVFFRIDSISHGFYFLNKVFSSSLFSIPTTGKGVDVIFILFSIVVLLFVEWMTQGKEHAFTNIDFKLSFSYRWIIYVVVFLSVVVSSADEQQFIYFQF
jgi:alginate O-acetyltransferase complex protein AlgI